MRYTVIVAGVVVNIAEWDGASPWAPDGSVRPTELDDVVGEPDLHESKATLEARVTAVEETVAEVAAALLVDPHPPKPPKGT